MPVAGEALAFLAVLLADDGFASSVLLEDRESVSTAFRFCLGGVTGPVEQGGDEELISVLRGMIFLMSESKLLCID